MKKWLFVFAKVFEFIELLELSNAKLKRLKNLSVQNII